MDVVGHRGIEGDLVGQRKWEAGAVSVGIVDIRFHSVEAFGLALPKPGVKDRLQDGPLTDVDVPLVWVPRHGVAEDAGRVLAGVRPVVFPRTRLQIAESFGALRMDLSDQGRHLGFGAAPCAVIVDVVDLDGAQVGRYRDRPTQVVLPRTCRGRLPPRGGGTDRRGRYRGRAGEQEGKEEGHYYYRQSS